MDTTNPPPVDNPKIQEVPPPQQKPTEGHVHTQVEENPLPPTTLTEGRVATQIEAPPIIEAISMTQPVTETQSPPDQFTRSPPQITQVEHKATSSSDVLSDISMA